MTIALHADTAAQLPESVFDAQPARDPDQLADLFRQWETPTNMHRVGAEAEKFGVHADTGDPISYLGERGVLAVFDRLTRTYGWLPEAERPGGPVLQLRRGEATITLEPGAQLELSGAPHASVHDVCRELQAHLVELGDAAADLDLAWLGVGFHPLARQAELPWVPKERYPIMAEYLPTRGDGALDMMRRTATVQVNFDYANEEGAMRRLRLLLRVAPVLQALLANSPFREGRPSGFQSLRGDVWLHMDPQRSGLLPQLWRRERASYTDYVEWALDAGMFFFKRGGRTVRNTGQTFRSFMRDGYDGEVATVGDFRAHLNTLFPEVRLKRTLEVRFMDSLPTPLASAAIALITGLVYDESALAEAEAIVEPLQFSEVVAARPAIVRGGLDADIGGRPVRPLAERLVDAAAGGLRRRDVRCDAGQDESHHLAPLIALVERGLTPARELLLDLPTDPAALRAALIERTRL